LRDEIKSLKAENAALKKELEDWQRTMMAVTPGGSEFTSPKGVANFVQWLKGKYGDANKRAVRLTRQVNELQPVVDAAVAEETAWDKAEKEDIGFFDAHKATDKRRAAVKAYLKKREGV